MNEPEPWYEGIAPEQQRMADGIIRVLTWGVRVAGAVNPAFCDAVYEQCSLALLVDPRLREFVAHVRAVADRETSREFEAHGPTTRARLWAQLADRLQGLTGREQLSSPGNDGRPGPR